MDLARPLCCLLIYCVYYQALGRIFKYPEASNLNLMKSYVIGLGGPSVGMLPQECASLNSASKLNCRGNRCRIIFTPLVFMIVLGTVLLNATTARLFAKLVRGVLDQIKGILIIGCL